MPDSKSDSAAFATRLNWPAALALALTANLALGVWMAADRLILSAAPPVSDKAALWSMGRPPGITFVGPDGDVVGRRGPSHGPPVRLGELPAYVPMAFLAAEDRRFHQHGAIDARGALRAAVVNLKAGRVEQGGSTIAQQLARNLFLAPERTLGRKLREVALAARLEATLSKDELLELYLNRIYFGERAYGLAAAAQTYFGKPPGELTLAEAAVLAALPRAPSRLSPVNDPAAAWSGGRRVLRGMAAMGWIDAGAARRAMDGPPPGFAATPARDEGDMAWVFDAAAAEAQRRLGGAVPDLTIQVTVDPNLQARAGAIVRRTLDREGRPRRAGQAALVALAPDGAMRAMIGGAEPRAGRFNRVLQARRQPGSAFKPIVWAAALDAGVRPADRRDDAPIRIGGWRPVNYGGLSHGAVTVQDALRLSINTVAVGLAREAGLEQVAELGGRFGLTGLPVHPGGSIALGAYEVTPLELAGAYQVLQTGGGRTRPYLVSRITDARGTLLYLRPPSAAIPVYPTYQAAQMVQMMRGVILTGTGREAAFGPLAAGKTGTSQRHRDAWFVGFTPDWLAAVWVGNDDGRPMDQVTGGQIPAHIWRDFMRAAHHGAPDREFPWFPALPPPLAVENPSEAALTTTMGPGWTRVR